MLGWSDAYGQISQNIASQIQGGENGIALGADQSFPEVEGEK